MATQPPPQPPPPPPLPSQQPQPPPSSIINQLVLLDTKWSLRLHNTAATFPRVALKLLEISGDGRFWFPVSISLFLSPLSLHSLHLYSFFLSVLLGLLLDLLVIGLVKHLIRRPRPVYNKGMHLTFAVDHWSFPSGHSSRVCFISAFVYLSIEAIVEGLELLKLRKGEFVERWICDRDIGMIVNGFALVVWVWSVFTSVSRVLLGRHFVFDVVVGACLGVLEAFFVFHFLRF